MRGVRQRIVGQLVLIGAAVLWVGFTAGPLLPCAAASIPSAPAADDHAAHRGHHAPTPAPDARCLCTGVGCCGHG
jgi:hypothetical protein